MVATWRALTAEYQAVSTSATRVSISCATRRWVRSNSAAAEAAARRQQQQVAEAEREVDRGPVLAVGADPRAAERRVREPRGADQVGAREAEARERRADPEGCAAARSRRRPAASAAARAAPRGGPRRRRHRRRSAPAIAWPAGGATAATWSCTARSLSARGGVAQPASASVSATAAHRGRRGIRGGPGCRVRRDLHEASSMNLQSCICSR